MQDDRVFVVATTADETRHALDMAQMLAAGAHVDLSLIVPVPNRVTVSSARAGVHDEPVDDAAHPDPRLSESVVRALADHMDLHPRVTVVPGWSVDRLIAVMPPGATVVICGGLNRLLETPEQRIARELSRRNFDVVFLPYVAPEDDRQRIFHESDMIRHLIS